jgi:DNA repair protein RadA/Sms
MLLAVLEKRAGFKLIQKDVFLNIAGGLKISDPAIDLAVICSILSSNIDIAIDHKTCFAGEVGLTGEIRAVNRIEQRVAEAAKLGFKKIYIPKMNKGFDAAKFEIEIEKAGRVEEVFRRIFG